MASVKNLAAIVFSALLMVACLSEAAWSATISGFVNYSGNQTGRVHLMLTQPDQNMGGAVSQTGIGTSILINTPGKQQAAYTLQGVPVGSSYELFAFMDTATPPTGYSNGASPIGKSAPLPPVNSPTQTLTNIIVNVGPQVRNPATDPNPWPLAIDPVRDELRFETFSNGFVINWRGPENSYGIEVADSYDIYWSTNPSVGPGVTTGGGQVLGKKAIYDNNFYIVTGLANGTSYYVAIVAKLNGVSSAITRSSAVVPAVPAGNGTITGTLNIDFGTVPSGRTLYVIADHDITGKIFAAPVMAGAASQTYTISNVEPGTYSIHTLYDVDNSHYINDGDLINARDVFVTIPPAGGTVTAPAISIKGANSKPAITTHMSQMSNSINYELELYVRGMLKHPAHIAFTGGPNAGATSIGIGRWGEFGYHWSVPRPLIGDKYTGTITYIDNTTEAFTVEVTGLIDALPYSVYPNGQISGTSRLTPTLSWRPSTIPQGSYTYYVSLYDYSIINNDNKVWSAVTDSDILATAYTGTQLVDNLNYGWNITIVDSYGNSSSNGAGFMPVTTGPTISSISPAGPLPVGTTGVIINGTGFDQFTPGNNSVYFNGFVANLTAASSTQLTVNLPGSGATGLVSVSVNGITTASPAVFTPTASYDSFVVDRNNIGMANVSVKRFKTSDKVTPQQTLTSAANGNYKFTGIQTAKPYFQTFTPSDTVNYAPSFTPRMMAFANFSSAGPADRTYVIMDKARIASWGTSNIPPLTQQAGKAMVRTRVADSNNNSISGAVVHAFSIKYGTADHYPVYYSTTDETTLTTSSTTTNGAFYILNVDPDDLLVITASKSGYMFNIRTYEMAADTVSQGRLTGTMLVSVSGFTPSSVIPGGTITITGSNFNTNAASNQVCFGTQCTTPGSATSTQLIVTVPCGAQNGPIRVSTNGQTAYSAASFTVPAPTITSIFPTQGPLNANVVIYGTNFSNCQNNQVSFNYQNSFNVSWFSSSQISAYVPFGATTGLVRVTTDGGTATGPTYTVLPNPSITSTSPESGPAGTVVTVTGSFYEMNPAMYQILVDGITATVNSVTANTLTFTIPGGTTNSMTQYYIEYFGIQYWNATFTVTPKLTVSITGAGDVNVTSLPTGTVCTGAWCRIFDFNTSVTLTASPSAGSDYGVWGGNCAGATSTPCTLTMDANKAVTASFPIQDNARLDNDPTPFGTVLSAYNAATVNGTVIKLRDKAFSESLNADNGTTVILSGGYAADFGTTHTGITSITSLIISLGSLTIDNLTIR